ncbi:hypothetical protein AVEN_22100-1 [Araneus ventricosus]|uniref:Uncharacterized protein n=1 Tax=Araneus ventricosus TaxID=182803 RepID=A0A4Y2NMT9_ARAVE|nr:hypothetical protein AVEN_22100-1 [Araneus ventricosus]
MVNILDEYNLEESAEKDASTGLESHANAANGLEVTLHYKEQHAVSTPTDVMFMRYWRNIISARRISSLRQKKITNFVSPFLGAVFILRYQLNDNQ